MINSSSGGCIHVSLVHAFGIFLTLEIELMSLKVAVSTLEAINASESTWRLSSLRIRVMLNYLNYYIYHIDVFNEIGFSCGIVTKNLVDNELIVSLNLYFLSFKNQ